jgi:hypothetical protein
MIFGEPDRPAVSVLVMMTPLHDQAPRLT